MTSPQSGFSYSGGMRCPRFTRIGDVFLCRTATMFRVLAGVPEGTWTKGLLNPNITAHVVASATFKPITRSNAALKAMNT